MLYFITAIYPEAHPVIGHFSMRAQGGRFGDIYCSEDAVLTVSGSGPVNASAAVAELLSLYPPADCDFLVNIGICGAPFPGDGSGASGAAPEGSVMNGFGNSSALSSAVGDCFRINKVTDGDTGREFYPDIMTAPSFREAALTTVSRPATRPRGLTDMEGAAVIRTALRAFSPDRIFLYKIVSDFGIPASSGSLPDDRDTDAPVVNPDGVRSLVNSVLPAVIKEVTGYASLLPPPSGLTKAELDAVERLSETIDASESMRMECLRLARYLHYRDNDAAGTILSFLDGLPSADRLFRRKEGKVILEQFRQFCLR